jgi:putative addiction module killer protein
MRAGNPGDVKPVGEGVYELRIDYGPGYRVYFAKQGEIVILLLLGGDKSTQSKDIREAIICWQDHKRRLSEGAKEGKQ